MSLNDALINRLRDGDVIGMRQRLNDLLSTFELTTPASHQDTLVESRVTLGFAAATPRAVQRMSAALLAGIEGRPLSAYLPSLIDQIYVIDPQTGKGEWESHAGTSELLMQTGVTLEKNGAEFLSDVLSAPICRKSGTLYGLSDWCPDKERVRHHIAKSGTPSPPRADSAGFDEFDWWVSGAIRFEDGRAYSYVVLVGSGSPSQRFAREKGAGSTAVLVDTLLEDLFLDTNLNADILDSAAGE